MHRETITKTFATEKEVRDFTLKLNKEYYVVESSMTRKDDTHIVFEALIQIED